MTGRDKRKAAKRKREVKAVTKKVVGWLRAAQDSNTSQKEGKK